MKKHESLEAVYIYIYIVGFNRKEKISIENCIETMYFRRI